MLNILNNIYVFIIGTLFGSFVNVCIYRLPQGKSIIKPRSYCPECKKRLGAFELIPIISYIIQSGKCTKCGKKINVRYPLVELMSGLLLWASYQYFGLTWDFFVIGFLNIVLLIVIFIDIDHMLILNIITLPMMIIGLLLSLIPHYPFPNIITKSFSYSAIGLIAGAGIIFFFVLLGEFLFKKEAMGMGDVKLLAMLGTFLGPIYAVYILFISSLLGAVYGLTALILKKKKRQDYIPYGPFIVLAAYIMIFFGKLIIRTYFP